MPKKVWPSTSSRLTGSDAPKDERIWLSGLIRILDGTPKTSWVQLGLPLRMVTTNVMLSGKKRAVYRSPIDGVKARKKFAYAMVPSWGGGGRAVSPRLVFRSKRILIVSPALGTLSELSGSVPEYETTLGACCRSPQSPVSGTRSSHRGDWRPRERTSPRTRTQIESRVMYLPSKPMYASELMTGMRFHKRPRESVPMRAVRSRTVITKVESSVQ